MTARVTPRAVGLTVLAAALVAAMVWLGLWQLGVYDDHQHDAAAAALKRSPVPLDDVLTADASFPSDGVSQPVTVAGTYVANEQFYVHSLTGSSQTYAVVTPLVTANGSAVLVVRGSSDTATADVPSGVVRVDGVLEPSASTGDNLDAQRVTNGIRISALVSSFDEDLYGGYVIARKATPPDALPLVAPPLGQPSRLAGLRNLLYAIQWWVFGGFVIFMWWRVLTDPGREGDPE